MKRKLSAIIRFIGLASILALGLVSIVGTGGGGGGGDGGGGGPVDTTAAAGVWLGTVTDGNNNIFDILGVISTDGQLRFIVEEGICAGTQYSGTFLTMNGNTGSGNFKGYAAEGCEFFNGEALTNGTFDITVAGNDVTGTYSAEGDIGTFSLTYDPIAESPTTLVDLQGNWGYYEGPGYFSDMLVSSDGSFTGTDDSGCDYIGQFSIIDPDFSIIDVSMTVSTCDDASFNGTYSGLGLRVLENGDDSLAIMISSSTNSGWDVLEHRLLRAELPCTGPGGDPISCQTNTIDNDLGDFWGEVGSSYDVTIRVRGVVEQKAYTGSTEVDGLWANGGTPDGSTFNIYKLQISSPAQTYYLNYGESFIGRSFALDIQKTVIVDEGAIVELVADAGGDVYQILNRDDGEDPIVIPGIPPAPDAFDGQFIQIDILSVVKK
jgi:hypothetical protein